MLLWYRVEVEETVVKEAPLVTALPMASGHEDASSSEQPIHKRVVEGIIHSTETAGDFEDRLAGESGIEVHGTWIAVKLVGRDKETCR
ncbi:hypothetical protein BKA82DRAFT_4399304 [Pisolithus tinctorius]|nr:hypothetical protein BKA82DRAFT_4399304 [Pisolithus tinctorius]